MSVAAFTWRHGVLVLLCFGTLAGVLSLDPIPQDPGYHAFADARSWCGIPNFCDVVSNLPFLLVGLLGSRFCRRMNPRASRPAWIVLFAGVATVSVGSAFYHWNPTSETLVWDRLPMTVAFMGLFVALLTEYAGWRAAALLVPAVVLGVASVGYWHMTDDLRPYCWVQLAPLMTIPAVMLLFRKDAPHQWLLLLALGFYASAKAMEVYDEEVFRISQNFISGHTAKHLLAAAACYSVLSMLRKQGTPDPGRVRD
ncbi:MAG: hypothetical protein CME07_03315 [Gemmatimonadetes bacterium]|nr:hypothetical protein [Gemmatimonadota bacterium]